MDVLYHITLRTSAALEQQRGTLIQEDLFDLGAGDDVKRKGEEVFGLDVDALREDKESDHSEQCNRRNECASKIFVGRGKPEAEVTARVRHGWLRVVRRD